MEVHSNPHRAGSRKAAEVSELRLRHVEGRGGGALRGQGSSGVN